jgi:hypothetical protein
VWPDSPTSLERRSIVGGDSGATGCGDNRIAAESERGSLIQYCYQQWLKKPNIELTDYSFFALTAHAC